MNSPFESYPSGKKFFMVSNNTPSNGRFINPQGQSAQNSRNFALNGRPEYSNMNPTNSRPEFSGVPFYGTSQRDENVSGNNLNYANTFKPNFAVHYPNKSGSNFVNDVKPKTHQDQFTGNTPKVNILQNIKISNGTQKVAKSTPLPLMPLTGTKRIQSFNNFQNTPKISQNKNENGNSSKTDNANKATKPCGSQPGEQLFILTGTVERIIEWHKLLSNHLCYYEVIAAVVSLREGTVRTQKIMLLRNRSGPILQVVYYLLTHITIEDFHLGQMIRCVGKMIGPNILNALCIRDATQEEVESLQRLSLISEQSVNMHLKI